MIASRSKIFLEVGHGEVFGFLGPNGAGKAALVRPLGTLIAPASGSAVVAGIRLARKLDYGVEVARETSKLREGKFVKVVTRRRGT